MRTLIASAFLCAQTLSQNTTQVNDPAVDTPATNSTDLNTTDVDHITELQWFWEDQELPLPTIQTTSPKGWDNLNPQEPCSRIIQTNSHALLVCDNSLQIIDKRYPEMQIHNQDIEVTVPIDNAFSYAQSDGEAFVIQSTEGAFSVFSKLPAESLTMTEVFRTPFGNTTQNIIFNEIGDEYATMASQDTIAYFQLDDSNETGVNQDTITSFKLPFVIQDLQYRQETQTYFLKDENNKFWSYSNSTALAEVYMQQQSQISDGGTNSDQVAATNFASFENWYAQSNPTFSSSFDSSWNGGIVEMFLNTNETYTRQFYVFGNPDSFLGEYIWIGNDGIDNPSTVFAVSHRTIYSSNYDIDLYQILDELPWVQLSYANIMTNLTEDEVNNMSFNSGSFFWLSNNEAKQVRICSYTERYNSDTNQCEPCTIDTHDHYGKFGTFMPQQSECQSCNTMVQLYQNDLIAMQNAYKLCPDPYSELTTAEWLQIMADKQYEISQMVIIPEDENVIDKTSKGTMVGVQWFLDNVSDPYMEKTEALNPNWLKWLCHAALIIGASLIGIIPVLLCICCCRKKQEEKGDIADGYPEQEIKKSGDHEALPIDSMPDRLPNQNYDEERPDTSKPISMAEIKPEFLMPVMHKNKQEEKEDPLEFEDDQKPEVFPTNKQPLSDRDSEKSNGTLKKEDEIANDAAVKSYYDEQEESPDMRLQFDERKTGVGKEQMQAAPGGSNDWHIATEEGTDGIVKVEVLGDENDHPHDITDTFSDD